MAKFASRHIKVSKMGDFKNVGKNDTPLQKLELLEPITKKEDGEYKTIGHNFFEAEIWGELASQSAVELREGMILDLSPEIKEGNNGQYVSFRARLDDNSWTYEGKEYHKAVVKIFEYEIKD